MPKVGETTQDCPATKVKLVVNVLDPDGKDLPGIDVQLSGPSSARKSIA